MTLVAWPIFAQEGDGNTYQYLDWVLYKDLPEHLIGQVPSYCPGLFVDPTRSDPAIDLTLDSSTQPVKIRAQKLEKLANGNTLAKGQAEIRQNAYRISADEIVFNPVSQIGIVKDDVEIRAPGMLIVSDGGVGNFRTGQTNLEQPEFVFHSSQYHGRSSKAEKSQEDIIYLDDTFVTRCGPVDPAWFVKAKKIKIDQQRGVASAIHATINIRGIPIAYMPYFSFPIDDRRKTGFLFPSPSFSLSTGEVIEMNLPFYWNIAPNLDDTFEPHYFYNHGLLYKNEFRYLSRVPSGNQFGTLTTGQLSNDTISEQVGIEAEERDRWYLDWTHKINLAKSRSISLKWADASDEDYFVDFQEKDSTTNYLEQYAQFDGTFFGWKTVSKFQQYAIINEDLAFSSYPYAKQPSITASRNWGGKPFRLGISFQSELAHFTRDLTDTQIQTLNIDSGQATEGDRWHSALTLNFPMERGWGYFRPTVQGFYTDYSLTNTGLEQPEEQSRFVPKASLNSGLILERTFHYARGGEARKFTQTLEPRLFYVNTPYVDQNSIPDFDTSTTSFSKSQLYATRRFSGSDRFGDMNRLTFGIKSRFLDQAGRERFSVSLDQLYWLEPEIVGESGDKDESATKDRSLLFGSINWQVTDYLKTSLDQSWDWELEQWDDQTFKVRYQTPYNQIANLDLKREWDSGEEIYQDSAHLSFVMPFANRWGISAATDYDLDADLRGESVVGLEYDSCCWNLRFLYTFDEEVPEGEEQPDEILTNRLKFEFELKGLGRYSGELEETLRSKINGYKGRIY